MPLEIGTYINDLVATNPPDTDQEAQGAAHIRLLKGVLKATLPNWTSAALQSSQAQLDQAVAQAGTQGTIKAQTAAGSRDALLTVDGTGNIHLQVTDTTKANPVTVLSVDPAGNLFLPAGKLIYSGTTATSFVGEVRMFAGPVANIPTGWHLCDGTAGTPDLRDRFVVGAGANYAVGTTGGVSSYSLSQAQLPSHTHGVSDPGHVHGVVDQGHSHGVFDPGHAHIVSGGAAPSGEHITTGGASSVGALSSSLPMNSVVTGVSVNVAAAGVAVEAGGTGISIQASGSGAAIENRPPYIALCYIMRIA